MDEAAVNVADEADEEDEVVVVVVIIKAIRTSQRKNRFWTSASIWKRKCVYDSTAVGKVKAFTHTVR
jgi:hypothetical protein